MIKKFLLCLIRIYQKSSRIKGLCRFQPTCSEYTYQSIVKYGVFKGTIIGVKRIFQCHPFSKGGYDPIP